MVSEVEYGTSDLRVREAFIAWSWRLRRGRVEFEVCLMMERGGLSVARKALVAPLKVCLPKHHVCMNRGVGFTA